MPEQEKALDITISKITIKNFKSLNKMELTLKKINTLVGPNGSGKTNIVESFILLKEILNYISGKSVNPFSEWWGYDNVVWDNDESLPIIIRIDYKVKRSDIKINAYYEIEVTGEGGRFQILRDVFETENIKLQSIQGDIEVILDDDTIYSTEVRTIGRTRIKENELFRLVPHFIEINENDLYRALEADNYLDVTDNSLLGYLSSHFKNTEMGFRGIDFFSRRLSSEISRTIERKLSSIVSEKLEIDEGDRFGLRNIDVRLPVSWKNVGLGFYSIYYLIDKMIILKRMSLENIRNPSRLERAESINSDASNVLSVLFTIGKGFIPERIQNSIIYAFREDSLIQIVPTTDGRIYLEFRENSLKKPFKPPSIPTGLFKLIAVELSLCIDSPLIIIDEIENSLHAKIIAYILDEFRESKSIGLFTTHSPALIDILDPSEVIIINKDELGETQKYRYKNSKEIREKLDELGITLSEYIFSKEN